MAKKKTAAAKKPAKKATTKAAKKTAAAAAATQPTAAETAPAPRPPCPEPEATHRKILQVCARQGIVISYQQLALLADAQIREVAEWARVVDESLDEHVPSLPQCLLDFQTRDVISKKPALTEAMIDCECGVASYRQGVITIPLAFDRVKLPAKYADDLFCGKHIRFVLVLSKPSDPQQAALFSDEELGRPTIRTTANVHSYKSTANQRSISLKVVRDDDDGCSLAVAEGFNKKPARLSLAVLGDADSDDDEDSTSTHRSGGTDTDRGLTGQFDDSDEYRDSDPLPPPGDQDDQDEEFGDGVGDDDDDEHPATLKLPTPAGEKLYLCQPQLAASLKLACVDTVPPEVYADWTDEQRDELDVWARMVARHAGGDTTIPLPPVPVEIQGLLPTQQFQNPVGFARAHGTRSQLRWHCVLCGDEYWDVSRARRCPQCDAGADQPDQVILLGFYGDPNVDFEGDFAGSDVECYTVLPETPTLNCSIRVVQGADGRWRTGLQAELIPAEGEPVRINRFPSFRDSGRTSRNDAIAAEIGRLIDQWGALVCAEAEEVVPVLKEYLARIEGGADPLELEHALPEAAS